jgi:two-component system response regulator LytT
MNCIIIEDVDNAVKNLEDQLDQSGYDIEILARMDSVEEVVPWLKNNRTDLIFLDVELGDGLGFEIFDHVQVKTPVIFTTSYDQYMARAFELNSISYLLKPITLDSLTAALHKFNFLHQDHDKSINERVMMLNPDYQQRFMVKNGVFFQSLLEKDVAYFYVQGHYLFITTMQGQQYLYDSTLEILEQRLDPKKFFRINRQFIIAFDMIKKVSSYDNRGRLSIEPEAVCKEELIVSIHRAVEFKNWLNR